MAKRRITMHPILRDELKTFAQSVPVNTDLTDGDGFGPALPGFVVKRVSSWVGGFGIGPNRHNAGSSSWDLKGAGFAAQFVVAWRTLAGLPGGKKGRWFGSYGLKHCIENFWEDLGSFVYMQNGAAILAAAAHDLPMREGSGPNVEIWIGALDWDVMRDNAAREIKSTVSAPRVLETA